MGCAKFTETRQDSSEFYRLPGSPAERFTGILPRCGGKRRPAKSIIKAGKQAVGLHRGPRRPGRNDRRPGCREGAAGAIFFDEVQSRMENSIQGLTKAYGDFKAVDHLDLEVADGELVGQIGRAHV